MLIFASSVPPVVVIPATLIVSPTRSPWAAEVTIVFVVVLDTVLEAIPPAATTTTPSPFVIVYFSSVAAGLLSKSNLNAPEPASTRYFMKLPVPSAESDQFAVRSK